MIGLGFDPDLIADVEEGTDVGCCENEVVCDEGCGEEDTGSHPPRQRNVLGDLITSARIFEGVPDFPIAVYSYESGQNTSPSCVFHDWYLKRSSVTTDFRDEGFKARIICRL